MAFAMVLYQRKILTSMGINLLIHEYVYPELKIGPTPEGLKKRKKSKKNTFYTLSCKVP